MYLLRIAFLVANHTYRSGNIAYNPLLIDVDTSVVEQEGMVRNLWL